MHITVGNLYIGSKLKDRSHRICGGIDGESYTQHNLIDHEPYIKNTLKRIEPYFVMYTNDYVFYIGGISERYITNSNGLFYVKPPL